MRELDWLILRKLYEKRSISKAAEDLRCNIHRGWTISCKKSRYHARFSRRDT